MVMQNKYNQIDRNHYIIHCFNKNQGEFDLHTSASQFRSLSRRMKSPIIIKINHQGKPIAYVKIEPKGKYHAVHRVLCNAKPGTRMEYINGDTLDVRPDNIRFMRDELNQPEPKQIQLTITEMIEPEPGKLRRIWAKIAGLFTAGAGAK